MAFDNILGGTQSVAVAAALATDTVISAQPARICKILVTTAGTANLLIYDNATVGSGKLVAVLKIAAVVGDVVDFQFPCANGITVKGNALNAGVTISFETRFPQ